MKHLSISMFVCLFMLWATPATADGVRDFLGTWEFTGSIGEESFVDEYHLAHVQTHHLSLFDKNGVTGSVGGDLEDGSPVALIPAESHLPNAFVLFDKDMWKEGDIPQCRRVGRISKSDIFRESAWSATYPHCMLKTFVFHRVGQDAVEGVIYAKTRAELEHHMSFFIDPTAYPFTGRRISKERK